MRTVEPFLEHMLEDQVQQASSQRDVPDTAIQRAADLI